MLIAFVITTAWLLVLIRVELMFLATNYHFATAGRCWMDVIGSSSYHMSAAAAHAAVGWISCVIGQ